MQATFVCTVHVYLYIHNIWPSIEIANISFIDTLPSTVDSPTVQQHCMYSEPLGSHSYICMYCILLIDFFLFFFFDHHCYLFMSPKLTLSVSRRHPLDISIDPICVWHWQMICTSWNGLNRRLSAIKRLAHSNSTANTSNTNESSRWWIFLFQYYKALYSNSKYRLQVLGDSSI